MKKQNTYTTKSVPPLKKGFKRGTYYLTPDLIRQLKLRAIHEGKGDSDVVRDALKEYLEKAAPQA